MCLSVLSCTEQSVVPAAGLRPLPFGLLVRAGTGGYSAVLLRLPLHVFNGLPLRLPRRHAYCYNSHSTSKCKTTGKCKPLSRAALRQALTVRPLFGACVFSCLALVSLWDPHSCCFQIPCSVGYAISLIFLTYVISFISRKGKKNSGIWSLCFYIVSMLSRVDI